MIYNVFKDNNVEVVGISLDENRTAWVTKILERNMKYIQLNDTDAFDADFAVACNVNSIPKMILTDVEGKIIMVTTKASQITNYLYSQGY
jgi:alkyl hydroperoxide reductase subunit AhpC